MAFKSDASFFRKIAIGAIGARAVSNDLSRYGHQMAELERGSTDTKLWKDIKRKRVRIPDLVCTQCGLRVESRAKAKAELAMSHSLTDEARAWDFGMVDSDHIAFPVCEPAGEDSWNLGRLGNKGSYWHEREWISWQIRGRINYFSVAEFRSVPYDEKAKKGVTEGSETTVAWAATFATRSGVVDSIEGRKVRILPTTGGRRSPRRNVPQSQRILVSVGDSIEVHQVLWSSVTALTDTDLACSGVLPDQHIENLIKSRERTQRFTGIKLSRLRREPGCEALAAELAADDEEDVYVRLEAASYLVSTCGHSPQNLFSPYINSPDPQTRLEAVIALAESTANESVKILSELLDAKDQPPFLRSAAAWGLGRAGGELAIDRLVRAFADVSHKIREEALEHLAGLGAAATPILLNGLRASDPDVAAGAAEALRQSQPLSKATVESLIKELRSGSPSTWVVWLFGHLPRDQVASSIADLQKTAPELHYAVSLLWSYVESWIARRWELCPDGAPPTADANHAI